MRPLTFIFTIFLGSRFQLNVTTKDPSQTYPIPIISLCLFSLSHSSLFEIILLFDLCVWLIIIFFPGDKLQEDRYYLPQYLQCLAQCLDHSGNSVIISWMNKWINEWIPKSQGCWETEAMVTRQLLARSSIWGRDEATAAGSGRVAWTRGVKSMALWDRSLWWWGFWQLVGCMVGCRCSSLGPPVAQPWAFKTSMYRGHAFWEQGEKVLMPEVGFKVAEGKERESGMLEAAQWPTEKKMTDLSGLCLHWWHGKQLSFRN